MQNKHHRFFAMGERGFSLIEIMIVSALLAVFAAIAMINISHLYQSNKTKSAHGDLRMVGEAMEFFINGIDFYPKLNFLIQAEPFDVELNATTAQQYQALENYHYMGFDVSHLRRRIQQKWDGKYLALGPGRVCRMNIGTAANPLWADYPKDFWGNPYVLYLLKIDNTVTEGVSFVSALGDQPDFDVLLVGYGLDKVPGSYINPNVSVEVGRKETQRLFTELQYNEFQMLQAAEYGPLHLAGYSERKFGAYTANNPLIGVIDPESDDVVIRLR
jgi:prepilin-type N-terminal cleavage/methylation domain-containing protein